MTKLIVAFCNSVNAPKNSAPTSPRTQSIPSQSLFMGVIAVCSENNVKHINALCGQHAELFDVAASGWPT